MEELARLQVALEGVGMGIWSTERAPAPCLFEVNANTEVFSLQPVGFYVEGAPHLIFLGVAKATAVIDSFTALMGDCFVDRFATEDEAGTLYRLLARAAGDDVHWLNDFNCMCRLCAHQRRRLAMREARA